MVSCEHNSTATVNHHLHSHWLYCMLGIKRFTSAQKTRLSLLKISICQPTFLVVSLMYDRSWRYCVIFFIHILLYLKKRNEKRKWNRRTDDLSKLLINAINVNEILMPSVKSEGNKNKNTEVLVCQLSYVSTLVWYFI